MTKNAGLGLEMPKEKCTDKKCPFHGEINIKPETFIGKVVKKDVSRSATIEWMRSIYVKKYERYTKRRSRLRVHNPPCLKIGMGDEVLAVRTRPLSKSKNFVIVKIIKKSGEIKSEAQKSKPQVTQKPEVKETREGKPSVSQKQGVFEK